MRRIISLTVFLFLSATSSVLAQEPIKVLILPWSFNSYVSSLAESGLFNKDEVSYEQIINDIKNIIRSKNGFTLSSKKLGITDDEVKNFYFPEGTLLPAPIFPAKKDIYDADLIISIQSPIENSDKYTELSIVAVETGKEATSLIEDAKTTKDNVSSTIAEKLSKGLDLANELRSIKADEIINPKMSVVRYAFISLNHKKIFIDVDYDGEHKAVQNVALIPSEMNMDGKITYELPTDKQAKILVTFYFKNNKVENVNIDTDFRPAPNNGQDVFYINSAKGFPIKITFTWEGQNIKNVIISPKDNPFPYEPINF